MRHFALLLFLFFGLHGTAQTADELIENVVKGVPRSIVKYQVKEKPNVYFFPTGFNDAIYSDLKTLAGLKDKSILKIELVYTTYRKSESFDQHGLNRKRLKALFQTVPDIPGQAGIEWVLIAQTGCTTAEMGKDFFHGVVITLREPATKDLVSTEIAFLKAVAKGELEPHMYDAYVANEYKRPTDSITPPSAPPKIVMPEFRGGERERIDYFSRNLKFPATADRSSSEQVHVQFVVNKMGRVEGIWFPNPVEAQVYQQEVMRVVRGMPDWKPATVDGKPIDCMVMMPVDFLSRGSAIPGPMEVYAMDAPKLDDAPKFDYASIRPTPSGKIVTETLVRNKWTNAALVCDVTGSMAPYNAQVVDWLSAHFNPKDSVFTWYVYFNDGDDRKDISKRVGSTGGVYSFRPANFDDALNRMGQAMNAGTGGDLEENNIEALLQAEKDCPSCRSTVLIADNLATPRDLSLIPKLTKPVHVIVCGTNPVVNVAYLNLARATKGTVHFGGKDYINLHTFEDGATVQIGKEIYVLKNGKFVHRR